MPLSSSGALGGTDSGSVSTDDSVVVGRITSDPNKHYRALKRFADYLTANLAGDPSRAGKVSFARDIESMAALLRDGKIDIVSETPFGALRLAEKAGAEILLREWKKGVATYRTVFFVRRDSDIDELSDLMGRVIAFEDAGSTSGFLVPYSVLRDQAFRLTYMASPRQTPPQTTIGYSFAHDEIGIATWVATGVTEAGALSDSDWAEFSQTASAMLGDLRIVHTTDPIVRSVIVARGDLPPEKKERLKTILLGMDKTDAGRPVLDDYFKVRKYDEIVGDAAQSLEWLERLYENVKQELN